jgi:hypothetical protein
MMNIADAKTGSTWFLPTSQDGAHAVERERHLMNAAISES